MERHTAYPQLALLVLRHLAHGFVFIACRLQALINRDMQTSKHRDANSESRQASELDVVQCGVTAAVRQHRDLHLKDQLPDPLYQSLPRPAKPAKARHLSEQTKRLNDGEQQERKQKPKADTLR